MKDFMKKKLNLLTCLFFLLSVTISQAQIGVGTEQPAYDFEAKGSVRFRDLEKVTPYTHYRQVRSDDEGHLTAIQLFDNNLTFKDLIRELMPRAVTVPIGYPSDLGLKLRVELEPQSETFIVLTYNIPIYMQTQMAAVKPHFAGMQLIRKEGGTSKILYGGSRKFSFPNTYPGAVSEVKRGVFVDGKYVDVIKNTSNTKRVVEYSLNGFTEGPDFTAMIFGDAMSDQTMDSMGVGVFSAMVFDQFSY